MIGSFLTRGLVMVLGYAYPAYECYKTVERNKPEIEQLRFWCQYWILVAVLTVFERVGDAFVSWVPMYSEAKLAFFIYLWYPKTRGTTYVYDSFFRPYVAKHENEIDRNLLELRIRAGDMAALYCQRAVSYGQTRIFEILQYVAAQSTPRPRASQPPPQQQQQQQQQASKARQPSGGTPQRKPAPKPQPEPKEPPSPTLSSSSEPNDATEGMGSSSQPKAALAPNVPKTNVPSAPSVQPKPAGAKVEASVMQIVAAQPPSGNETANPPPSGSETANPPPSGNETANPPPKETIIEEAIRVTRGRLRKARSAGSQ